MMQFIFIKYELVAGIDDTMDFVDTIPFVRDDATAARVAEHSYTLEATFKLDPNKIIERGMLIAFMDTNGSGAAAFRAFEIRGVRTSQVLGTQTIEAEDLGMTELQDSILSTFTVSGVSWDYAANEALDMSLWLPGTLDPNVTLPPATYSYKVFKVSTGSSSKLALRSSPSSSARVIAYYTNGTQVREVSDYNSTWKKVTVGGNTGYMSRSYLTLVRTVTVPGTPSITMTETRKTRLALLLAILDKVGLKPRYRIAIESGLMVRYVDYISATSATFNGARIEVDQNVFSDSLDYDDRGLYTRVYPVGKDGITITTVNWSTGNGNPGNSPVNYDWLEDEEAARIYSRKGYPRSIEMSFPDAETPTALINAAWEWLQTVNKPKFSLTLSVRQVGKQVELGEIVNVILLPILAPLQASVVELTRDLLVPENTEITIGNHGKDVVANVVQNTTDIADLKDRITTNIGATVLDVVHPIGSIVFRVDSTDPGTLIGGTWTRIKDRFLMAAGDTYANGATGGAAAHKHLGTSGRNSDGDRQGLIATNGTDVVTVDAYRTSIVDNNGGSTPNITVPFTGNASSMPPYLVVYVWKRTA